MDEKQLQQAFMMYLAKASGAKDEKELQLFILQLGEDGLKKAYSQFMQEMQKGGGQAAGPLMARKGAKLLYIKRLRGICKEDEEPAYYKVGGTICKKCLKKKQVKDPGALPITAMAGKGTKVVKDFKVEMKKKKMKKCLYGSVLDNAYAVPEDYNDYGYMNPDILEITGYSEQSPIDVSSINDYSNDSFLDAFDKAYNSGASLFLYRGKLYNTEGTPSNKLNKLNKTVPLNKLNKTVPLSKKYEAAKSTSNKTNESKKLPFYAKPANLFISRGPNPKAVRDATKVAREPIPGPGFTGWKYYGNSRILRKFNNGVMDRRLYKLFNPTDNSWHSYEKKGYNNLKNTPFTNDKSLKILMTKHDPLHRKWDQN